MRQKVLLRRGSKPYQLLKYLAAGTGVLVLSVFAPAATARLAQQFIKVYFRKRRFERSRFLNDLKNLQARQLISYRELDDGRVEIAITARGKEKMLAYNLDDMKLDTSRPWDRKWRLIIFDIPHDYKQARDAFREKLKELSFYRLQKSVFITPHHCEDEIEFLASVFEVRRFVLMLEMTRFEGEEKLRHYFRV